MNILLKRNFHKELYTIGAFSIGNEYICDSLELPKPIQAGTYEIELRFSPTFKQTMPYLKNVPQQHDIMIHIGNSIHDTKGCLLVGKNTIKGRLTESTKYFNIIFEKITCAISNGERVFVEIQD
ncbi:MAG: DUF5675 family protein [Sulfurimonas sp.]|jgi:hypothetical protein